MKLRLFLISLIGCVSLGLLISYTAAQAPKPRLGRLTAEEEAALVPGLAALFTSGEKTDLRITRLAALHVPKGTPPSVFLPSGPFRVHWTGYLKTTEKGEYLLRAEGEGNVVVRLGQAPPLEWKLVKERSGEPKSIELVKGYNPITIEYSSLESGAATLRLWWSSENFVEEPLPPDALFTRGDTELVQQSNWLRNGRQLFAERGCIHCHALPEEERKGSGPSMPELSRTAPNLIQSQERFEPDYLAAWILNPQSLRSHATMPQVLKGTAEEREQQAVDLAAFLAGEAPARKESPLNEKLVEEGEKLFETLGCIGCHHTLERTEKDPHDRLSLRSVWLKFRPNQLAEFLKDPHKHYSWSRMPHFKLDATKEIPPLVAYLSKNTDETLPKFKQKGNAERGKKLFAETGCAHCHQLEKKETKPTLLGKPSKMDQGCLSEQPQETKAPDFQFSPAERTALQTFLKRGTESLKQDLPAEFVARQMQSLQCTGCHRRDGKQGKLYKILEEENLTGVPPQPMPTLTWTGEKLRPEWTRKLLEGNIDHKARPWLKSRMPAFPQRAEWLALGLSHEHGFAADENPKPVVNEEQKKIGAKLMEQNGGLYCYQCHAVGDKPAVQPFEAPGINLLDASLRLRYSYYPRWMLDPTRVDPSTKMPRFAPDLKTTTLKEIYDGNARQQFDALWMHIESLSQKKDASP